MRGFVIVRPAGGHCPLPLDRQGIAQAGFRCCRLPDCAGQISERAAYIRITGGEETEEGPPLNSEMQPLQIAGHRGDGPFHTAR